jgi:hypothetical protein
MTLSKKDRELLRMKFGGKCAYCGCELAKGWHADHLQPVEREWWKAKSWWRKSYGTEQAGLTYPERDVLENLMPACRACNLDKHASSLESWRRQLEDRVNVCRRNYSAFRHAERFGLVKQVENRVIFWFEKCGGVTLPAERAAQEQEGK